MVKKEKNSRWGIIIGVLLFLFIFGYIFSGILNLVIGTSDVGTGNVAIIPVKGIILTEQADLFSSGIAVSSEIVSQIEKAVINPTIEAIILEINSPGGAPVATDEIATAIAKTNKTTVAWIREVGASGGYWIASATEHIVANRMTITGSIGVIGSYLDFSGFIQDWNISYQKMVAGKYKDTGTPWRKLEEREERLLQKKLDLLHDEFKDAVKENRNLSEAEIRSLAEGEFYLGKEAINLGLIDELGGKDEAIRYIEKKLNISVQAVTYEKKQSLLDVVSGLMNQRSFYFGKGLAQGEIAMFR